MPRHISIIYTTYHAQIFVKSDTILPMVDPVSQEFDSIDSLPTYTDIYPTIEDLLDLIEDAIEKRCRPPESYYDDFTGFPRIIAIDYNKEIAD